MSVKGELWVTVEHGMGVLVQMAGLCVALLAGGSVQAEGPDFPPLFIKCINYETTKLVPVRIAKELTVNGRYSFWTMGEATVVENNLLDDLARVTVKSNSDKQPIDFVLRGLSGECVAIFSANEFRVMKASGVLDNPYDVLQLDGSVDLRFTTSDKVDNEIIRRLSQPDYYSLRENALIVELSFYANGGPPPRDSAFMVLDGEITADKIVNLDKRP